jgi:hypothetical protein
MRVSWDNVQEFTSTPWSFLIVRVDLTRECSQIGPIIYLLNLHYDRELRVDENYYGPAFTTQSRRLQGKIIMKAADIAFMGVFNTRRLPERISHVSCDKIPTKLINMFYNLFSWYGYKDYLPVYGIQVSLKGMDENLKQVNLSRINAWQSG